jgi:hypothetical protein
VVVPASAHARLPDYDLSFGAIELRARIDHSTAISYTHGCSTDSSPADRYAACNGDNAADRGAANRDTYAGAADGNADIRAANCYAYCRVADRYSHCGAANYDANNDANNDADGFTDGYTDGSANADSV